MTRKRHKPNAAAKIAAMMDGKVWTVDLLDDIADLLRAAGYQIRDSDEQCPDCENEESTYCGSFCDSCLERHCEECEVCAKDFS